MPVKVESPLMRRASDSLPVPVVEVPAVGGQLGSTLSGAALPGPSSFSVALTAVLPVPLKLESPSMRVAADPLSMVPVMKVPANGDSSDVGDVT